MKQTALFLCALFLTTTSYAYDNDSEFTSNLNVFFGVKKLDKNDWDPLQSQTEMGILFDTKQKDWPVSIAIDILYSWDDEQYTNATVKANTTELDLGLIKRWENAGSFSPYVGGGISLISAEGTISYSGYDYTVVDDSGVGGWVKGGASVTLDDGTNIGFELRYSQAEVELNDFDYNYEAGGFHAGVFVGYHW